MLGKTSATKRIARQAGRLRVELRKVPFVKRALELRERAARGFAEQVASLPLPIATKHEVARIDRQVTRLTRRLRELEQGGSTEPLARTRSQNPGKRRGRKKK